MWVLHFLPEIESDMSAFHRVDDIYTMESAVFFRRVPCLPAYDGALATRKLRQLDAVEQGPVDTVTDEESAWAQYRQQRYAEYLAPGETPKTISLADGMQLLSEGAW